MLDRWGDQVAHGWVTGDDEFGRHTRFRHDLRERGERYVLGVPCTTTMRDLEAPLPAYAGRGRRPKGRWKSRWSGAGCRHGSSANAPDPRNGWWSPGNRARTRAPWDPAPLAMPP